MRTENIRKLQEQLIENIDLTQGAVFSKESTDAYFKVPRHHFVSGYQSTSDGRWHKITKSNLGKYLPMIYSNSNMILSKQGAPLFSIMPSPSLALQMLDIMKVGKGQHVFEFGTGSGWNAAMMGHLVGRAGQVITTEVIPELAQHAKNAIDNLGMAQVKVLAGDGYQFLVRHGPYDRVVVTAGAWSIPKVLFQEVKAGGLLLFLLKNKSGIDNLILFKKQREVFHSVSSSPCHSVPMVGQDSRPDKFNCSLNRFLADHHIKMKPSRRFPFYWAGPVNQDLLRQILASFLAVVEPTFQNIVLKNNQVTFGLADEKRRSLVLALPHEFAGYGSSWALDRLVFWLKQWVTLGMPSASDLCVRAIPSGRKIQLAPNEWKIPGEESNLVFSLPKYK